MDGHIWIESEGLGKGCSASFIVKLGFPDRPNEAKLHYGPKVQANHVQTNFAGLKVLVMDDNGLVLYPFGFSISFYESVFGSPDRPWELELDGKFNPLFREG